MLFRYSDPRILRVYLPTCLPDELEQMFGPVTAYVMESEDADTLNYYSIQKTEQTLCVTDLPVVLSRNLAHEDVI